MDDWDYKISLKNMIYLLFDLKIFISAALVPHDNKRMVTILITSFGK
jgi:hypothetical protein